MSRSNRPLEKLLGSDFANKAPAQVVQKERERLAAFQDTAEAAGTIVKINPNKREESLPLLHELL